MMGVFGFVLLVVWVCVLFESINIIMYDRMIRGNFMVNFFVVEGLVLVIGE